MRDLTLFGKVTIIKAFLQSQLVYQLSVLPSPDKKIFQQIEKTFFKFLWSNKPDKIKRSVLYNNRDDRGINMPDIESQNKSLKIAWIKRLFQSKDNTWCRFLFQCLPPGDLIIFKANLHQKDIVANSLTPKSDFWKSVLTAWTEIHYTEVHNRSDILNQIIWYNSHLKIQGRVYFYRLWYNKDICYIKDLLNEDLTPLSYRQFRVKYNINVSFLQYYSVISSIPRAWKITLREDGAVDNPIKTLSITSLLQAEKPNRLAYNRLITSKSHAPTQLCDKGRAELGNLGNENLEYSDISNSFIKLYKCTIDTKIRAFQFRLIHRIIGVNQKLAKWGINPVEYVIYVKAMKRLTYIHLFYECNIVRDFWNQVQNYINELFDIFIPLNGQDILLGCQGDLPKVLDLLITVGKMYIYYCKMSEKALHINGFKKRVESIRSIEKYTATKNNNIHKFNDK